MTKNKNKKSVLRLEKKGSITHTLTGGRLGVFPSRLWFLVLKTLTSGRGAGGSGPRAPTSADHQPSGSPTEKTFPFKGNVEGTVAFTRFLNETPLRALGPSSTFTAVQHQNRV